ncbi:hypothetical protein KW795_00765 [Candidatus Microgenomates bacterium]|nr:hypothetical protein [Candidatus Microgenomates bacterium]
MAIENFNGLTSDIDPWEITPARIALTENLNGKWDAKDQKMKAATPEDPKTGEIGIFAGFGYNNHGLCPMYVTKKGNLFFV